MKILVTAGNTQTPIDRVRCITNIFSGRTGARVATTAAARGHTVTLLTSHPEVVDQNSPVTVRRYQTFSDLDSLMAEEILTGQYDIVIHAAAVSDYQLAGIYTETKEPIENATDKKVKSSHSELWLHLIPTPKLVDKIRKDWGFSGTLMKFKLEVGVSDAELLEVAERSRTHSDANWMCANTLEGMQEWAYVGNGPGRYVRVNRNELAERLIRVLETNAL